MGLQSLRSSLKSLEEQKKEEAFRDRGRQTVADWLNLATHVYRKQFSRMWPYLSFTYCSWCLPSTRTEAGCDKELVVGRAKHECYVP